MTEPLQWLDDGTAFNPRYGDRYHSSHNQGLTQARGVFLQGNDLPAAWAHQRQWRILETGFGCGLNFLVTWAAWRADPQRCHTLHFTSVEAHPVAAADIVRAAPPPLAELAAQLAVQFHHLLPGVHRLSFEGERVLLTLLIGEAQTMLRGHSSRADSLYLDGFSPRVNPHMWSADVFAAVARHCHRGTTLATWCVAASVRNALMQNGFSVQKIPGAPPKRVNLRGHYAPTWPVAHLNEGHAENAPHTASNPPTSPKTDFWTVQGLAPAVPPQTPSQPCAAPTTSPYSSPHPNSSSNPHQPDVIVIGAGLAGAAAAHSLAQRGLRVLVVEAGPDVAAGASGLPAGVFAPQVAADDNPRTRLSRAGLRMTLQRLRELSARSAITPGQDWAAQGVLERMQGDARALKNPLFFNELSAQYPSRPATAPDWNNAGFDSRDFENSPTAPPLPAALWHTHAGWVRPTALVRAQLNHPHIQVRTHTYVARLQNAAHLHQPSPMWQVLDKQGNCIASAPHIIIATGASSTALLPVPALGQIRPHRKKSINAQENPRKISENTLTPPKTLLRPTSSKVDLGRGQAHAAEGEHSGSHHDAPTSSQTPLRPTSSKADLGRGQAHAAEGKHSGSHHDAPTSSQTPLRPTSSKVDLGRGQAHAAEGEHSGSHSHDAPPAWPLRPVRGQVVLGRWSAKQAATISPIPLNGNGNFVPCVLEATGEGGALWVMGSTFERDAVTLPPAPHDVAAAQASIATKACALLPAPVWAAIAPAFEAGGASWAAVRCTSSDRLPLVGRVGGVGAEEENKNNGLWALTALGARGLTLSVLCGELLAAWMLDEPLPIEDALAAKLDARRSLPELPPG